MYLKTFCIHPVRCIIIVSLVFNLFIALAVNRDFITSDGGAYHQLAVNLALCNGYSRDTDQPFEPQFFREPGYPFFFSLACRISKLLGNEVGHMFDREKGFYNPAHKEFVVLRVLQALLVTITTVLFYYVLLFFLKPKVAFFIAFSFVFYYPFSIFITYPLREILISSLLMGMSYLTLRSAKSNRPLMHDIAFAILAVMLVLTLQAYVYILPFFGLSSLAVSKSFSKTIRSWTVIGLIFIVGVAPWTYRGYKEANDIRVAKTFGVAYTYELKKFLDANYKAHKLGLDDLGHPFRQRMSNEYWKPGHVVFKRSFNGYYKQYADSLQRVINSEYLINPKQRLWFTIKDITANNFRKSLVWPLWKTDHRSNMQNLILIDRQPSMIVSFVLGVVFFLGFAIGFLLYFKHTWVFIPVFLFHFLLIPFMADEGRRVLPYLPFYYMFAFFGFQWLVAKHFKNNKNSLVKNNLKHK